MKACGECGELLDDDDFPGDDAPMCIQCQEWPDDGESGDDLDDEDDEEDDW